MDLDRIGVLIKNVEFLETKVNQLSKEMSGFKMDEKRYLRENPSITPSVGVKVAYDQHGLILRTLPLEPSDIPTLQISQVDGLKKMLDSISSTVDIKKLKEELNQHIVRRNRQAVSSGIKINYDENGFVVSSSDLLAEDIPTLPMSKIEGLSDLIDIIKSMTDHTQTVSADYMNTTKSGTFTKVSVDSNGRVTSGDRLTLNDLPSDLISIINDIESRMIDVAPLSSINNLSTAISKKVDSNPSIEPGTYTKLTVDSKGLVTKGSKITISDLPELTMDCITGLKNELNHKADHKDIVNLNNSMSNIINTLQNYGDINKIRKDVDMKSDKDSVERLRKEFISFRDRFAEMQELVPFDMIVQQLHEISNQISTMEGRISVLEKRLTDMNTD